MAGVFVTRGMTWGTPGVVISLDEAGKPVAGSMAIQVHFDVGPTWLQIALHHLEDSKVKQLERIEAWKGTNQKAKAAALEGEFETSMQAIMAAAIAIDAFYAVVQTKTKLPAHLITSWRAKKTASYAQICEVLRLAFSLRRRPRAFCARTCELFTNFGTKPFTPPASSKRRFSILSFRWVWNGVSLIFALKTRT